MQISIIAVGKLKEAYLSEAVAHYKQRLAKYCRINVIEVADEKAPENLSAKEMTAVKDAEGERILACLTPDMYVIALVIEGRALSSPELARQLQLGAARGGGHLALVIGGSLGLADAVLKRADFRLSFSPMTFPHQLMRVIVLEQLQHLCSAFPFICDRAGYY